MRLPTAVQLVGGFALLLGAASVLGQGTFQNLDFESADVSGSSPGSDVPITSALPGWSGYYTSSTSTNATAQVAYDGISIGGAVISILDSNAPGFKPLQGMYSVVLFGGGSLAGEYTSSTISQTGLVPTGTKSLLFDGYVGSVPFIVTLGGQTISVSALQTFSSYTLYGGNIPAVLAGQNETLSFTEPAPAQYPPSMVELDNIQFSDQSVPEPGVFGLSALGALLAGWRFLRRRR